MKLEEYAELFLAQGYDDMQVLVDLTKRGMLNQRILENIGISKCGHRARILCYLEAKANLPKLS